MANVTWEVAEPNIDPFAATVGDMREYVVHVCQATDVAESEVDGIFVEFLRQIFDAALMVSNPAARRLLIEIDTINATLTAVCTDEVRTHDEAQVFKLYLPDWVFLSKEHASDVEDEAACERTWLLCEGAVRGASGNSSLAPLRAELLARQFHLWIYDPDEEETDETLSEVPLAGR